MLGRDERKGENARARRESAGEIERSRSTCVSRRSIHVNKKCLQMLADIQVAHPAQREVWGAKESRPCTRPIITLCPRHRLPLAASLFLKTPTAMRTTLASHSEHVQECKLLPKGRQIGALSCFTTLHNTTPLCLFAFSPRSVRGERPLRWIPSTEFLARMPSPKTAAAQHRVRAPCT